MSKRLLFIAPMFPQNSEEDGVVPFINQFSTAFIENTNIEIDLISLFFPKSKPYMYNNINVYPIGSGFKRYYLFFPYLIKAIYKGFWLCRKNKYDGILCFWYRETSLLGKILSFIFNIKLRVWMLGQDAKSTNKYPKLLKLSGEKIIMISKHQKLIFLKEHNIEANRIANVSIDRKRFPPLNTSYREITILGVGNLSDLKNYSLFIEILSTIKKEFKNIKAVICGADTGDKTNLEKKITDLDLDNNITFTGSIAQKEVLSYMNNATLFLHTSKFEGSGTVLHEALYSGCKVISTIPIENPIDIEDSFFYSTNRKDIENKILALLKSDFEVKRVEKFKMEDTVKDIYDSFYA
jgi:glycosyltransferase involved in cell wall biosynthesis